MGGWGLAPRVASPRRLLSDISIYIAGRYAVGSRPRVLAPIRPAAAGGASSAPKGVSIFAPAIKYHDVRGVADGKGA